MDKVYKLLRHFMRNREWVLVASVSVALTLSGLRPEGLWPAGVCTFSVTKAR
jgi:hypothetical protein